MPIIEARQLTKRFRVPIKSAGLAGALKHLVRPRYEDKTAVDAVNIQIEPGESVAYIGPNGAGKSTTVKLLTGVLTPTSGEVRVRGLVPHQQRMENNRNIGVVFGQRTQLWWDLPVQESLRLLGDIYAVPEARFVANLHRYAELLELEPLLHVPTRQLSLGQRMRCDIAAALLHSPAIVYLDEPTIGLDVAVKARLRQFLKQINREAGMTIVLTSHDLGDIEELCERLIMIDRGKIVFDGSLRQLRARFGSTRTVHFALRDMAPRLEEVIRQALGELAPCDIGVGDYQLTVQFDAATIGAAEVISRVLQLVSVEDLRIEEPSVESIIRQLYEGRLAMSAQP
jgi:ABC-2 type transport system ATP-binding protein